jgi:hypothetical protein
VDVQRHSTGWVWGKGARAQGRKGARAQAVADLNSSLKMAQNNVKNGKAINFLSKQVLFK